VVGDDVKKWEKKYTLREHGGPVSGIDWCPTTNLIATCGHDRNAYVWKYDQKSDSWKPTLVILRINRAATFVKWSPAGNKFAVASGAKCVPICQFEESSDWWISKMIKKHKSTVLSLAWCCNNKFIVTGGCDHKCRIFSAYIPGLDPAEDDGFGEVWPAQHEFGTCLAEFNIAKSWVQSVAWSPNGFRLCFTGHNSTMHFIQILAGSKPVVKSVSLKSLPFLAVRFLTDNTVVGVGFDNTPTLFTCAGNDTDPKWTFQETLDKEDKKSGGAAAAAASPQAAAGPAAAAGGAKGPNAFSNTKNLWQDSAHKGIAISGPGGAKKEALAPSGPTLKTRHTNTITCIFTPHNPTGPINKFWTSGIDGRVLQWDLAKLKTTLK